MEETSSLRIELIESLDDFPREADFDYDAIIYDLENQINLLSSQAGELDYLVSAASGLL